MLATLYEMSALSALRSLFSSKQTLSTDGEKRYLWDNKPKFHTHRLVVDLLDNTLCNKPYDKSTTSWRGRMFTACCTTCWQANTQQIERASGTEISGVSTFQRTQRTYGTWEPQAVVQISVRSLLVVQCLWCKSNLISTISYFMQWRN